MKLTRPFVFCLLCLISLVTQAQSTSDLPAIRDPVKFDEYTGDITFSDEKARLDNLAIHLQRKQSYVAYLVVCAGRQPCAGEAQARAIRAKNHLVKKRGLQPNRVMWMNGGYREELTIEIWTWPRSVGEPYPSPTVNPGEVRVKKNCQNYRGRRKRVKS